MSAARATKSKLPTLTSDEAAERFVAEADLSEFDLSVFQPHCFEFAPKSKHVKHAPPRRAVGMNPAQDRR